MKKQSLLNGDWTTTDNTWYKVMENPIFKPYVKIVNKHIHNIKMSKNAHLLSKSRVKLYEFISFTYTLHKEGV